MAIENAKTLNVRIKNKYDSYENWANSGLILEAGEIAIAYTTVNVEVGNGKIEQHPELLMKVGDGSKSFANLPWLSAKAADVAAWAKAANKPTYEAKEIAGISDYIAEYVETEMGISVDTDTQYQITKVDDYNYKLQSKGKGDSAWADVADSVIVIPNDTAAISALQGLVGDKKVATQISEAIAALDLANTYEAKGEAAKVQTALNEYKTANDAAVQKNATDIAGEIARAKAAEEANTNAINAIKDGTTLDSFKDVEEALAGKDGSGAAAQALVDAKAYADGLNNAMDARVDALEAIDHEHANKEELDKIAVGDKAKWDAMEQNAKDYVDGQLEDLVGDSSVADQIAALKLSDTYAAKEHTHTKSEITDFAHNHEISDVNGLQDALDGKQAVGDYATKAEAQGYANAKDEAIAAAKKAGDDAQAAADKAQEEVDALEVLVGTLPEDATATTVVAYVDEKTAGIASDATVSALAERVEAAEGEIDALQADLNTAETGLKAKVAALEGLVGDKKVSEAIAAAVKVEEDRAKGIEGGLESRLAAVEGDYLKGADKTELEGKITANANAIELLTNGVSVDEVDGVNDLIKYVKDHGTEVTGMQADIKANADAIDALAPVASTGSWNDLVDRPLVEEAGREALLVNEYCYPTDHFELKGKVVSLEPGKYYFTKTTNHYGDIGIVTNEYEVELSENSTRVDVVDESGSNVLYIEYVGQADGENLTAAWYISFSDTRHSHDITIEKEVSKTVFDEEMIPASIARVSDQEALAARVTTAEGEIDTLQADLNAETTGLKARMTAAESDIDALETKVGDKTVAAQIEAAIEALKIGDYAKAADLTAAIEQHGKDKQALEADIAKKANDADLAAIAKTGSTDDLVQGELVLVFDCGTSAV